MKKILISLLISLLFSMNVYASDYTNYATWTENYWSNMDFFWTYDKNTELITLNFWKYLESNTTNKISITAKLLDDECSSEIEFKNFYLQWNCNIKVSKELFEPIAKAELIVSINEQPIYTWLHWITFEWYDAQILWNGLQTEAIQDISSTDLNLKTTLEWDFTELFNNYTISLEPSKYNIKSTDSCTPEKIDSNSHSTDGFFQKPSGNLIYDNKTESLSIELELSNINKPLCNITYSYAIKDEVGKKIANGTLLFEVNELWANNYNWEDFNLGSFYDEDKNSLFVNYSLDWDPIPEDIEYEAVITVWDNKTLVESISYDKVNKKIVSPNLSFRYSSLKNWKRFEVLVEIRVKWKAVFFSESRWIEVDFDTTEEMFNNYIQELEVIPEIITTEVYIEVETTIVDRKANELEEKKTALLTTTNWKKYVAMLWWIVDTLTDTKKETLIQRIDAIDLENKSFAKYKEILEYLKTLLEYRLLNK